MLATLSATRSDNLIADGEATASALNSGYHLAYLIGAALLVAGIVVAVTVLRQQDPAEAMAQAGAEAPTPAPVSKAAY